MKARNKYEKRVETLCDRLDPITKEIEQWAFDNTLAHFAYRTKKKTVCLSCNSEFNNPNLVICPSCNRRIHTNVSKSGKRRSSRSRKDHTYFFIATTVEDIQVLRYFYMIREVKAGHESYFYIREVFQHWLSSDGKSAIRARMRMSLFNGHYDNWSHDKAMSFKRYSGSSYMNPFYVSAWMYPGPKVLPVLKRNGFRTSFHDCNPVSLFNQLLNNPKVETLFKAKYYSVIKDFSAEQIDKYWPSLKICIRNNYMIKDASMWKDHINTIQQLGKDHYNPMYVCPANLEKEHQKYIAQLQRLRRRQEYEKRIQEIRMNDIVYQKEKNKYFGVFIKDDLIEIRPLKSVHDFYQESEILNHCVFNGAYYLKKNSLVLSARINNTPIETIEVSLSRKEILQSRGQKNQITQYHDRIVNLVRENMNSIIRPKKKKQHEQTR